MARQRDYHQEYANRIAKADALGLSKTVATGHAKESETPIVDLKLSGYYQRLVEQAQGQGKVRIEHGRVKVSPQAPSPRPPQAPAPEGGPQKEPPTDGRRGKPIRTPEDRAARRLGYEDAADRKERYQSISDRVDRYTDQLGEEAAATLKDLLRTAQDELMYQGKKGISDSRRHISNALKDLIREFDLPRGDLIGLMRELY